MLKNNTERGEISNPRCKFLFSLLQNSQFSAFDSGVLEAGPLQHQTNWFLSDVQWFRRKYQFWFWLEKYSWFLKGNVMIKHVKIIVIVSSIRYNNSLERSYNCEGKNHGNMRYHDKIFLKWKYLELTMFIFTFLEQFRFKDDVANKILKAPSHQNCSIFMIPRTKYFKILTEIFLLQFSYNAKVLKLLMLYIMLRITLCRNILEALAYCFCYNAYLWRHVPKL